MKQEFFTENRQRLTESLKGGPVILSAYHQMQRGNDAAFHFEQEANFWYLTGIESPNWLLILDGENEYLIAPEVSEIHQVFDGSLSAQEATNISGISTILSAVEGETLLKELATNHKVVTTLGIDPHASHYDFYENPAPLKLHKHLEEIFSTVKDCRKTLAVLRAIKQPEELNAIRTAINITIDAFEMAKSNLSNYAHEYELEADFTQLFRRRGAKGHAYDPIIAGGKNACTLHYGKNEDAFIPGDLVLLDVGARYKQYAADITRTYAIGEVSERHRIVHQAVEEAHHKIIELLQPGLSVKEYFDEVDRIMSVALNSLGLLKEKGDYRKYFPHSVSHGLGIDVHDSLGGPDVFLPGMVLTVEPGIYIPEEGIGVRIEDDILITETGHENLSARLPTSL